MSRNRFANSKNEYQGTTKRVLCVCSAGLLRSPTAAVVLSQEPFNFNTRAVGVSQEYALIKLEEVHTHWADEIVCMQADQVEDVKRLLGERQRDIICLNIEDSYGYRDPELMWLIKEKYLAAKNE